MELKKTPIIFECKKCDFECSNQIEWDKHVMRPKHKKTPIIFECKKCDFECSKQSDWDRHVLRPKHKKTPKMEQSLSEKFRCTGCGCVYKYASGLWKHSNTCIRMLAPAVDTSIEHRVDEINALLKTVISNNAELHNKNLILQQQLYTKELVTDKDVNINNLTINTNTINKNFNLNVFLNNRCKDAMNITDFINTFNLQFNDLENVGENGYIDGISNIIIKRLGELNMYNRPIHCSDTKRDTLVLKDANSWETETDVCKTILRSAIKIITKKNSDMLYNWSIEYPMYIKSGSGLNNVYVSLVTQAMGGDGKLIDNENKIIHKILKSVAIDKELIRTNDIV